VGSVSHAACIEIKIVTKPFPFVLTPNRIPSLLENAVTFLGTNFSALPDTSIRCELQKADTSLTSPAVSTPEGVICNLPELAPGNYSVTVVPVETAVTPLRLDQVSSQLQVYPRVSQLVLSPSSGPHSGGTKVFVSIPHRTDDRSDVWACRFGAQVVKATTSRNHNVFVCTSPEALKVGLVDFAVLDSQYSNMGSLHVLFGYYRQPVAISVSPSEVTAHSHTALTIAGKDLLQNLPLTASMSEFETVCSVLTDALAHCTFDSQIYTGTFRLQLSLNRKDWVDSHFDIQVSTSARIDSVFPSTIAALGGVVTVSGSNFGNFTPSWCFLGDGTRGVAVSFNVSSITCTFMQGTVGDWSISLLIAGSIVESALLLTRYPDPVVLGIQPTTLQSSAPHIITVSGSGLGSCDLVIGNRTFAIVSTPRPADFIILLEHSLDSGCHSLYVSCKTTLPVWSSVICADLSARVSEASPLFVSSSGGQVTVFGQSFAMLPDIGCIVGDDVRTKASWMSSSAIACTIPELKPGNYTLSLTHVTAGSTLSISVVHKPRIVRIFPDTIYLVDRETITAFLDSTSMLMQFSCVFGGSVRTPATHLLERFAVTCEVPALPSGLQTFELMSHLGSHSDEAMYINVKESPFQAAITQDCYVGSVCNVVFVSPVPWDSVLECSLSNASSISFLKSDHVSLSAFKCAFIASSTASKVMLVDSLSRSILSTHVVTCREQPKLSVHSISIHPNRFSASSSVILTIFGVGLSSTIKCALGDRFEFAVIEQSPTQAILLLEAPLLTIGNFTFACQGGYSTRLVVEAPDTLTKTLNDSVFKLKEVRLNSSSVFIGMHTLLPFTVVECNDCVAQICVWTIMSEGSFLNKSSNSVWSDVLNSQACEVPNIETFGIYGLQIYGNNFASSSTDIYVVPFIAASNKVVQNCKENDVTFELESSYPLDSELQCRMGMQSIPTFVVMQRHVRCMYGSTFAILNKTVSLSSRWGLIAANDTWNNCNSPRSVAPFVEVLGVAPQKATIGIQSNITITMQTNEASAEIMYHCLWDFAFQTEASISTAINVAETSRSKTTSNIETQMQLVCNTPHDEDRWKSKMNSTIEKVASIELKATYNGTYARHLMPQVCA
jgi:hypothetical protein